MSQIIEVKVPDIGNFHDVPIIDLCVAAGASVNAEDPLLTLESDKATMEVEAVDEGIIAKIVVPAGTEAVKVNALIAILESAIAFSLDFDLLLPPYEENKRVTVDQFNTKMDNSKFVTGKRLGYDFEVEDI